MTLVRWNTFRDLVRLQEEFDRRVTESFDPRRGDGDGAWVPPVDVFEKGDHLVIRAELPGMNREDIDIRVENGVLQMRGERRPDPELSEKAAYRVERACGRFARSFALPTTVDATMAVATYRDGVLEIEIAKAESARPRKVQIEAA